MNPLWQDFLTAQGAQMKDGRVIHFGHPALELAPTPDDSIIADLSHLGMLQADGTDALTFLQGQLTNDVKLLDGNNSQYTGYCTPKGRLLTIFLAFTHHDHIYLQLNGALTESVLKRLKMYVMRSHVTLTDISNSTVRIGLAGTGAAAVLSRIFDEIPQQAHQVVNLESTHILRLPGDLPRFEIITAPEQAAALWTALQPGCTAVGTDRWEWLEIKSGTPDVVLATQEAFVPQMVNLDLLGGINFKKGCYTGQEIVARTHYLGKVKRRTYLAHMDTALTPQAGDPLYGSDSQDAVGQVVRAATAPAGGFDLLAELRSESAGTSAIHWASPEGATLTLLEMPYSMA